MRFTREKGGTHVFDEANRQIIFDTVVRHSKGDYWLKLVQLKPRGLWRFSTVNSLSIDRYLDHHIGEMPLKVLLLKWRMGLLDEHL